MQVVARAEQRAVQTGLRRGRARLFQARPGRAGPKLSATPLTKTHIHSVSQTQDPACRTMKVQTQGRVLKVLG